MKGRIILLALIVVFASVASAAIFKYDLAASAAEGTVVLYDGSAANGTYTDGVLTGNPIGIVIQVDGTGAGLVANSGITDYTHTFTEGALLTYTAGGALEEHTGDDGRPTVAIAMADNRIMITIKDDRAAQTHYEYEDITPTSAGFLGEVGSSPDDVQEAIDKIDLFLQGISATVFHYEHTETPVAIGSTADVTLETVAHTGTAAAPALAGGDEIFLTFEGEFTDEATTNGAVITLQFFENTTAIGAPREIYLVDRDFYQKQVVSMELYYTVVTGDATYSVEADGDATYDGGSMESGAMTLERF